MNEIVYPTTAANPLAQVVIGLTAKDLVPPFLKYGCSVRKEKIKLDEREITHGDESANNHG